MKPGWSKPVENEEDEESEKKPEKKYGVLRILIVVCLLILGISLTLILGKDKVHTVLLWLETIPNWQKAFIFILLFTLVSFPFAWGYLLLNLTCGYLYGFWRGLLFVSFCAACGITIAQFVMRYMCQHWILQRLERGSDYLDALLKLLSSQQGLKVAVLARITPIPFGLQNALFATTDMKMYYYTPLSMVGMLPLQILNTYIGSTLRSMEDILRQGPSNPLSYGFFVLQILVTIGLMLYMTTRAREELKKAAAAEDDLPEFVV